MEIDGEIAMEGLVEVPKQRDLGVGLLFLCCATLVMFLDLIAYLKDQEIAPLEVVGLYLW